MLVIAEESYREMIDHLRDQYPLEGCGFLSGRNEVAAVVHPVPNELKSSSAFRMDPEQQLAALLDIESRGLEIHAIFHSHPGSGPHFSTADVAGARFWPVVHLVVGLEIDSRTGRLVETAAGYTLTGSTVSECPLKIV